MTASSPFVAGVKRYWRSFHSDPQRMIILTWFKIQGAGFGSGRAGLVRKMPIVGGGGVPVF